jgi:hypothetical protein
MSRSKAVNVSFVLCVAIGLYALNFAFDFPITNQYTYMIHAYKLLGMPGLARDWLAHTADPAPLVTWLSALAIRLGGSVGIGALYFGCCLIFVACWHRIATQRFHLSALEQFLALPTLLLPFFNPFNLWLSYGIAEQYLLGGYWQPSEAAGAALILAFTLFVLERPFLAVLAAGLAAALHPGSLLAASLVAGTVILDLMVRRAWRSAAAVALAYTLCVLPVVAFALLVFQSGTPEIAAEGARILVHERIPHHTLPTEWLGPRVAFCLGLVLVAIVVCRRDRRIAFGLAVPLGAGILLSLAAALVNRDTAYLLFPWRISAMLVPLAWLLISIAAARSAARTLRLRFVGYPAFEHWAATVHGRGLAMALILAGVAIMPLSPFHRSTPLSGSATALIAWVDAETSVDAVFIVPLQLEWFRLGAERPILVDWKSNPYRSDEVIEWHNRVKQSRRIMEIFCHDGRIPEEAAKAASLIVIDRHGGCPVDIGSAVYTNTDFAVFKTAPDS